MSGIFVSYRLHRGDVWQVFEQLSDCPTAGAKNATFCAILYLKTDHFTKTGSGQT